MKEAQSMTNLELSESEEREKKLKTKRSKYSIFDLCILGPIDVIGDFEVLVELDKFYSTAVCVENCVLLFLEYGRFDAFFRRHRDSRQRMCDRAKLKVELQLRRMPPGAVPLMDNVKSNLDRTKTQQMQAKRRLKEKDLVPVKKIANLPRGPIINNYGPGGLFYIIALQNRHVWEAAAEREMAQRHEAAYKQITVMADEAKQSQKKLLNTYVTMHKLKREESPSFPLMSSNELFDKINDTIFDWYETLQEELQIPFGKCNIKLDSRQ